MTTLEQAEANHDRALARHEAAWNAMHRIGLTQGHDSELYVRAREHTIKARRVVSAAAKRAEQIRGGAGPCPYCGGGPFKRLSMHLHQQHPGVAPKEDGS